MEVSEIVYILLGILMFGVLIFIHELGHFLAAKKMGVGIYEFSIGMGPAIFKKTGKDGTVYALRLLPFGGFVSMYGEDEDDCPDKEKAFSSKSAGARFIIIAAGALMNLLLGFILSAGLVIFGPDLYSTKVERFNFVDENGTFLDLEEYKGLRKGDEIIKVGSRHINVRHDLVYEAISVGGEEVTLTVLRDGKKVKIENFTFPTSTEKNIVIGNANFFLPVKLQKNPLEIIKQTFCQSSATAIMVWDTLIDTVTGRYSTDVVQGPVGVVSEVKETAKQGPEAFIYLVMLISINLGVANLLPLPALDGGRLLFLLIEIIRRKPINPKYEGIVHFVGLALLLTLMVFVTFNDIVKLFQ